MIRQVFPSSGSCGLDASLQLPWLQSNSCGIDVLIDPCFGAVPAWTWSTAIVLQYLTDTNQYQAGFSPFPCMAPGMMEP
ncbi:unnamed protein product [Caretta caretta]